MSKYFEVKTKGLDKLEKAITDYSKKDLDKNLKKAVKVLGASLYKEIKSNTPVDTGELKRSWKTIIKAHGYSMIIYNTKEYAIYVEYGHRKRDKKSWVEGQYFLKQSMDEFNNMSKKDIEKIILNSLKNKLRR